MNDNTYSAQNNNKGLRTFVLTLSVSLIIFSVVYYLMADSQSVNTDLQASNTETLTANISEEDTEEPTVFGKIVSTTPDATSRAVLAGTTTSPTSTGTTSVTTTTTKQTTTAPVPNGGVTQLTWGFIISLLSFALGFVIISKDPRSLAVSFFERNMLKDK